MKKTLKGQLYQIIPSFYPRS